MRPGNQSSQPVGPSWYIPLVMGVQNSDLGNLFALLANFNDANDSSPAPNVTDSKDTGRTRKRRRRGRRSRRNRRSSAQGYELNNFAEGDERFSQDTSCSNTTLRTTDSSTQTPPARSSKPTRPGLSTPKRSLSSTSDSPSPIVQPPTPRQTVKSPARTPQDPKPSPRAQISRNAAKAPPLSFPDVLLDRPHVPPPPPQFPFRDARPFNPYRLESRLTPLMPGSPTFDPECTCQNKYSHEPEQKCWYDRNWGLQTPPGSPKPADKPPLTPKPSAPEAFEMEHRGETARPGPLSTPVETTKPPCSTAWTSPVSIPCKKDVETFEFKLVSEEVDHNGWGLWFAVSSSVGDVESDDEGVRVLAFDGQAEDVRAAPTSRPLLPPGGGVYVDEKRAAAEAQARMAELRASSIPDVDDGRRLDFGAVGEKLETPGTSSEKGDGLLQSNTNERDFGRGSLGKESGSGMLTGMTLDRIPVAWKSVFDSSAPFWFVAVS